MKATVNIFQESEKKVRFELLGNGAGYALLELQNVWHIELMNIAPQRRGFGTLVLMKLLNWLRSHNIIRVTVHPSTVESVSFFKKHGFIQISSSDLWELNLTA